MKKYDINNFEESICSNIEIKPNDKYFCENVGESRCSEECSLKDSSYKVCINNVLVTYKSISKLIKIQQILFVSTIILVESLQLNYTQRITLFQKNAHQLVPTLITNAEKETLKY